MPKEIKITEEMLAKAWDEVVSYERDIVFASVSSSPGFTKFKAALGFKEPLRIEAKVTWFEGQGRGVMPSPIDKIVPWDDLIGKTGTLVFTEDES